MKQRKKNITGHAKAINPLNVDSWKALASEPSDKTSSSIFLPRIKGLKVLVLGTVATRLNSLANALYKRDVKVIVASASEEGYRIALNFSPDVVISQSTKPGEPGWWLFRRFHRHPILRWTPALLMKWWKDTDDSYVDIDTVVMRLSEALTPVRILEERIEAHRNLSDKVEMTGVETLLKVFINAKMTGSFLIHGPRNDFQLDMSGGKINFVSRDGIDNENDNGEIAFLQILLCNDGHWTFKKHDSAARPKNIELNFAELQAKVKENLICLFGPDAVSQKDFFSRLRVRPNLFHDIASTLDGIGRSIAEALAAGASENELEAIMGDKQKSIMLESAMALFVRCGAIVLDNANSKLPPKTTHAATAKGVMFALDWIANEHRMAPVQDGVDHQNRSGAKKKHTGFYHFSDLKSDRIIGNINNLQASGARSLETHEFIPLSGDSFLDEGRSTPLLQDNESAWRREYPDMSPENIKNKFSSILPRDSFAPSASPENRGYSQMLLALVISILIGGLLVAGLVVIGSDSKVKKNARSQRNISTQSTQN